MLGAEGRKRQFWKELEKFSSSRKRCSPNLVIRERQIKNFPLRYATTKKTDRAKSIKGEEAEGGLTSAALLVGVEIRAPSSLVT